MPGADYASQTLPPLLDTKVLNQEHVLPGGIVTKILEDWLESDKGKRFIDSMENTLPVELKGRGIPFAIMTFLIEVYKGERIGIYFKDNGKDYGLKIVQCDLASDTPALAIPHHIYKLCLRNEGDSGRLRPYLRFDFNFPLNVALLAGKHAHHLLHEIAKAYPYIFEDLTYMMAQYTTEVITERIVAEPALLRKLAIRMPSMASLLDKWMNQLEQ